MGILTPVAIVKPIEIDGSTVERCSLFNLSVLKEKLGKPYVGQKIEDDIQVVITLKKGSLSNLY